MFYVGEHVYIIHVYINTHAYVSMDTIYRMLHIACIICVINTLIHINTLIINYVIVFVNTFSLVRLTTVERGQGFLRLADSEWSLFY